jgi:hypothetical protein
MSLVPTTRISCAIPVTIHSLGFSKVFRARLQTLYIWSGCFPAVSDYLLWPASPVAQLGGSFKLIFILFEDS